MMTALSVPEPTINRNESGSYRDRTGRVFYHGDLVLRGLNPTALADWEFVSRTDFFQKAIDAGSVVHTERVSEELAERYDPQKTWAGVLRHERVPVISYPFEWSFQMLRKAALTYLDLMHAALDEEVSLKDGTSYNMQWNGVRALFIDIPSFHHLQPGEPWLGYRQFCQLFLYPLMLSAYKNVDFQPWLRGDLEGPTPSQFDQLMTIRDWFRAGVFTHVHLHARLDGAASRQRPVKKDLHTAGFQTRMIQYNVRGLKKIVAALRCSTDSEWSDYEEHVPYNDLGHTQKQQFVSQILSQEHWKQIWDLGCNTGEYSRLAAPHADYVLALDRDPAAIDRLFAQLQQKDVKNVLPLVCDLANPTSDCGWRNRERTTLLSRGRPQLTLSLALMHHLSIGANIPLASLVDWLTSLGPHLIVEFVSKQDPMVQQLLRNKRDDYDDYRLENFEALLGSRCKIVNRCELSGGTRTLYYAVRN